MADDPRLTPPEGEPHLACIAAGSAPVRKEPRAKAALQTEALFGETVRVYAHKDGWAHVQLRKDFYVGYVPEASLGDVLEPTHTVCVLRTFVFPEPDIKAPPQALLSMGSKLAVMAQDGVFVHLASGGFVIADHVGPVEAAGGDFVTIADRFVGTPYLWGGKTSVGLDCSGLVQVCLDAIGVNAPRDTDMQEKAVGQEVGFDGPESFQRGDLVFWKGHVAIARGDGTIIHANAHHMMVAIEPAGEAIERIRNAGSPVTSVRRLIAGPHP